MSDRQSFSDDVPPETDLVDELIADRRRQAAEAIESAVPMSVPEPAELKRELDELSGRRDPPG